MGLFDTIGNFLFNNPNTIGGRLSNTMASNYEKKNTPGSGGYNVSADPMNYVFNPSAYSNLMNPKPPTPPPIKGSPTPSPASSGGESLESILAALKALNTPVNIPALNLNSLYQTSKSKAITDVTPYFQNQLSLFMQSQAAKRNQQQQEYQNQITDLGDELNAYLGENEVTRTRTAEDTTKNLGQIGEDEQLRQTAEGRMADRGERGLRDQVAEAGMSYSGLGQQAIEESRTDRALTEKEKTTEVARKKEMQNLFKTRTFEDLSRGDTLKTQETDKGKTRAKQKYDYDTVITDLETQMEEIKIEMDKMAEVSRKTGEYEKMGIQDFIGGLGTQAQKDRAAQVYGGML